MLLVICRNVLKGVSLKWTNVKPVALTPTISNVYFSKATSMATGYTLLTLYTSYNIFSKTSIVVLHDD